MDNTAASARRNPNLVLTVLLVAYIFNFLDRQILGILAQPIKDDLGLSDTEFGAIGGLAFALLYSVLGVPLSYLADRTSRSWVIAGALTVWSGFTALCGTATSFWQLFLYRLGVGVGEAGGVAPSYALIADYFPPHKRARALGIFSLGVPIGLGAGTLLGAYIAALIDWRAAFLIMGVAGIAFAPLLRWVARDVPRQSVSSTETTSLTSVFAVLARKPAFWLMAFAASCSSLIGYGLALWVPSILMRSFGLDIIGAGQFMGSLLLIGGTLGVLAGGFLADRLGHADRRWYARLPAIAWLITAPFFLVGSAEFIALGRLAAARHPQCPQYPVARPGHHGRPAFGRAADARDSLRLLPADQQFHWIGCRPVAHWRGVRSAKGELWRPFPALCGDCSTWLLPGRGCADVGCVEAAGARLGPGRLTIRI